MFNNKDTLKVNKVPECIEKLKIEIVNNYNFTDSLMAYTINK